MQENNSFVMYLSSLKPKFCAGHNRYTVRDNLKLGGDIYPVKQKSSRSVTCKKVNFCFVFCLF